MISTYQDRDSYFTVDPNVIKWYMYIYLLAELRPYTSLTLQDSYHDFDTSDYNNYKMTIFSFWWKKKYVYTAQVVVPIILLLKQHFISNTLCYHIPKT